MEQQVVLSHAFYPTPTDVLSIKAAWRRMGFNCGVYTLEPGEQSSHYPFVPTLLMVVEGHLLLTSHHHHSLLLRPGQEVQFALHEGCPLLDPVPTPCSCRLVLSNRSSQGSVRYACGEKRELLTSWPSFRLPPNAPPQAPVGPSAGAGAAVRAGAGTPVDGDDDADALGPAQSNGSTVCSGACSPTFPEAFPAPTDPHPSPIEGRAHGQAVFRWLEARLQALLPFVPAELRRRLRTYLGSLRISQGLRLSLELQLHVAQYLTVDLVHAYSIGLTGERPLQRVPLRSAGVRGRVVLCLGQCVAVNDAEEEPLFALIHAPAAVDEGPPSITWMGMHATATEEESRMAPVDDSLDAECPAVCPDRIVGARQLAVGGQHRALVPPGPAGGLQTWGQGGSGQLGHGDTRGSEAPKAVRALAGHRVRSLACGGQHTAALTDCGLYTWGHNGFGQLGHGHTKPVLGPRRVGGDGDWAGARKVACGMLHTVLLDGEGGVWTWGAGKWGQLGHGDLEARWAPQRVQAGLEGQRVLDVAAGLRCTVCLCPGGVWASGRWCLSPWGGPALNPKPDMDPGAQPAPRSEALRPVPVAEWPTGDDAGAADGCVAANGLGQGLLAAVATPMEVVVVFGDGGVRSVACPPRTRAAAVAVSGSYVVVVWRPLPLLEVEE